MWDTSIKNCSQCRLRRSELCVCFESRSVRTSEMQWNICWLGRRKAGSSKSWDVLEGACFKRRRTMANISLHKLPTPWITLPTPTSPSLYIYSTYIYSTVSCLQLLPSSRVLSAPIQCKLIQHQLSGNSCSCHAPSSALAAAPLFVWQCRQQLVGVVSCQSAAASPPPPTPLFLPQHLSCIVCGKNRTQKKKE